MDITVPVPATFLADRHGNILSWEPRCTSLSGHSAEAAKSMSLQHLFPAQLDADKFERAALNAVYRWNELLHHKGGGQMQVELSCEKIRVSSEEIFLCTVIPSRDIARSTLSLANIIDSIPGLFFIADLNGHLLAFNRHCSNLINSALHSDGRAKLADFVDRDQIDAMQRSMFNALSRGHAIHEAKITDAEGVTKPYLFTFARRILAGQAWLFCSGIDITDRKKYEQQLLVNERAMDACVNAIIITKRDQEDHPIEYVNPAFCSLTGYSKGECIGRDPSFMKAGSLDDEQRQSIREALIAAQSVHVTLRNCRKDGTIFWNDISIDPVRGEDDAVSHFVAVMQDVTEARKSEAQLRHLAMHDPLTGLVNRTVMEDRLRLCLERARRDDTCIAVIYVDLDNFKLINDSLGHATGDMLLQTLAQRLMASVRAGDTVARIGGDEFVAVINDCRGHNHVAEVVGRLHTKFIEPLASGPAEIFPSASFGISIFPHDGEDALTILHAADAAMYRAKTSGKNQYRFYSAEMNLTGDDNFERDVTTSSRRSN